MITVADFLLTPAFHATKFDETPQCAKVRYKGVQSQNSLNKDAHNALWKDWSFRSHAWLQTHLFFDAIIRINDLLFLIIPIESVGAKTSVCRPVTGTDVESPACARISVVATILGTLKSAVLFFIFFFIILRAFFILFFLLARDYIRKQSDSSQQ